MPTPIHKRRDVRKLMREAIAVMKIDGNWRFYDQSTFGRNSRENPCETECCFCGWIDWLLDANAHNADPTGSLRRVAEHLQTWGIPVFFAAEEWSLRYRKQFYAASGPERVNVLERRVEHWFRTGE